MPAKAAAFTPRPMYPGEAVPAWILALDLHSRAFQGRRGPNQEQPDETAEPLVQSLLATAELSRGQCSWFGWDAFGIELPQPWTGRTPGPLARRWTEARLFCEKLEVRLQRGLTVLQVRILTEADDVRQAALQVISSAGNGRSVRELALLALPGELLLAGGLLSLGQELAPGSRGVVHYPRLLRYQSPEGLPTATDASGRLRMKVSRYFDEAFRLRAVRYRCFAG